MSKKTDVKNLRESVYLVEGVTDIVSVLKPNNVKNVIVSAYGKTADKVSAVTKVSKEKIFTDALKKVSQYSKLSFGELKKTIVYYEKTLKDLRQQLQSEGIKLKLTGQDKAVEKTITDLQKELEIAKRALVKKTAQSALIAAAGVAFVAAATVAIQKALAKKGTQESVQEPDFF